MTEYRVLCIGSAVVDINASPIPAYDQWKEKQRIGRIGITTGGDAANQAMRLADAGVSVSLAACTGTDSNGSFLIHALRERGVDTSPVRRMPDMPTSTALVLVNAEGERRTFSAAGAHPMISRQDVMAALMNEDRQIQSDKDNREDNKKDKKKDNQTDSEKSGEKDCEKDNVQGKYGYEAVSLASLFSMPVLERDGLEEVLAYCRSKGIMVFADLGSDKLGLGLDGIRKFLPYIDYFMPSLYDAVDQTGVQAKQDEQADQSGVQAEQDEQAEKDLELAREAARVYLDCGAGHVVIKCGAGGCLLAQKAEQAAADSKETAAAGEKTDTAGKLYAFYHVPAAKVAPVDTTGAGDCMAALFISRILAGDDMVKAAKYACCGASLSTLYAGACGHVITHENIRDFLQSGKDDHS